MAMQDATKFAAGGLPPGRGAEWIHHYLRERAPRDLPPPPVWEHLGNGVGPPETAIHAYVNHGRWIAECPDCHGAQLACRTDHRFLCNECGNVAVDNKWRRVVWPLDAAEIEAALTGRPRANQNWNPGETVEDLLVEGPDPATGPLSAIGWLAHGGGD